MITAFYALSFGFLGLTICSPGGQRFGAIGFLAVAVGLLLTLLPSVSLTSAWNGLVFASAALLLRCPDRCDWPSGLFVSFCIAICVVLLGSALEAAFARLEWTAWLLQPATVCLWALVGAFLARIASRSRFPLEYAGLHWAAMLSLSLDGTPTNYGQLATGGLTVVGTLALASLIEKEAA